MCTLTCGSRGNDAYIASNRRLRRKPWLRRHDAVELELQLFVVGWGRHGGSHRTAAVTTISTRCGGSRSTPRQARMGGLAGSTHSSQARFISFLREMSAM